MRWLLISLIVLTAGCSPEAEEPAQTTTFLISGPEEPAPKEAIEVRRFEVVPESVKRGQALTANVELASAAPSRALAIDWHGPDGWVVAHQVVDAGQTRIAAAAPIDDFEKPGRYRAVLRSGWTSLAEDAFSITG